MKGRESGMPEQGYWESFFDADKLFDALFCGHVLEGDLAEFGTGYGTFTIPASRRTAGTVYSFEIEPDLAALVTALCQKEGLGHVRVISRDFVDQGTGLSAESIQHALLFNILHIENPVDLLREAFRILRPGGVASIIHWRQDIPTPRGPSLSIRPSAAQCIAWAKEAGFYQADPIDIADACPFHYGVLLTRS
ncbi:MAG: methyltransferase domain-containing protein [bacterium]|jgi:SAM-dependent methyltransferase|nr:methyltransferase domain-containing protein [bacterium]